jgi:hypothetical protein
MLQLNDNSSIQRDEGGNFRPPYAVDMQIARQSDDQVAGGWYSTVSGGRANKASAAGSTVGGGGYDNDVIAGNIASGIATTIAGGHGNEANNFYSAIGGGDFNSASGFANSIAGGEFNITSDYGCVVSGGIQNTSGSEATFIGGGTQNSAYNTKSVIGGGNLNTTNGAFSAIVGGESNTANADYSFIGASNQAMTDKYGQAAHAAGSFANAGDAQASEYVARTTTSDGSWTEVFLDGNSARMNIANNTAWTFVAQVTGLSSGGDVGSYEIKGAIKNNGTVSIVGTVSVTTIAEDNAAWDVKAEADNGNSSLKISVKGSLATDMRWVVSVRTTEVKY